jgi:hypothetical protein
MHRTYLAKTAANELKFADAVQKIEGPFTCISCDGSLIVRQGDVRVWHYAHAPTVDRIGCVEHCGESLLHRTAKHLLAVHLDRWRFHRCCSDCGSKERVFTFCAGEYVGVEEHAWKTYRIDVAVLSTANSARPPHAAIEVLHTHAVTAEKRVGLGILVIEVSAASVIACWEAGMWDLSYDDAGPLVRVCQSCRAKLQRPCLGCGKWFDKTSDNLQEVDPPRGHDYPCAYLCTACGVDCPTCDDFVLRSQVYTYKRCVACNVTHCEWKRLAARAQSYGELSAASSKVLTWYDRTLRTKVQGAYTGWKDAWTRVAKLLAGRVRSLPRVIARRCRKRAQKAQRVAQERRTQTEMLRYQQKQKQQAHELARRVASGLEPLRLDVSYEDKDEAKAAGATWDPEERKWYARGRAACLACKEWWSDYYGAVFYDALPPALGAVNSKRGATAAALKRAVKFSKAAAGTVTLDALWARAHD